MIDVSSYQGRIDWPKVHAGGVTRAYIKLLEHVIDPYALRNLNKARSAGVEVGVYFFAHPSESPAAAARRFIRLADQAKAIRPGDLPPALDLEVIEGHSYDYLNDWKAQWFAAVDHHVGTLCAFYSYYYFWKQMRLYPNRPVWGAALGNFAPPKEWFLHQYSFTGRVPGIIGQVDLDRFLHDVPRVK